MHEISVLVKALKMVEEVAEENKVRHIKYVTLEIGELTGYLPIFFEQYFPIVIEGRSLFNGCELKIHVIKGQALCRDCETFYNVLKCEGACPKCGSRDKKILGGQDFVVKDIGIDMGN